MKPENAAKLVETQKRRRKVERAILSSNATLQELAIRHGVTINTIHNDVKWIRSRWKDEQGKNHEKRRALVKRLEFVFSKAMESYERSRQDEEEITTGYRKEDCTACRGRGRLRTPDRVEVECSACGGTGKQEIEIVSKKVRGQAGDASFLNTARTALMNIAKLEGLLEPPKRITNKNTQVNVLVGSVEEEEGGNPFEGVPDNLLLEARDMFDRLQQAKHGVIEVCPNPPEH
jgi:hypothetical protein